MGPCDRPGSLHAKPNWTTVHWALGMFFEVALLASVGYFGFAAVRLSASGREDSLASSRSPHSVWCHVRLARFCPACLAISSGFVPGMEELLHLLCRR